MNNIAAVLLLASVIGCASSSSSLSDVDGLDFSYAARTTLASSAEFSDGLVAVSVRFAHGAGYTVSDFRHDRFALTPGQLGDIDKVLARYTSLKGIGIAREPARSGVPVRTTLFFDGLIDQQADFILSRLDLSADGGTSWTAHSYAADYRDVPNPDKIVPRWK